MYKNPYTKIKPKSREPYTEVFLVRHCHPDYSLEKKLGEYNMPLSKSGRRQRKFLTDKLLTLKIDKVYVSGLRRAQETAATYVRLSNKEIIEDRRLDEINWTSWYNLKYFNMSEKTRERKLKNHSKLDRELDRKQATARRALADLFHSNKGKTLIIFSHGNFIKALLTGILNADVIGFLSLDIFQASISKLIIDQNGYIKISYINNVSHLPKPPRKDLFITLAD